MNIDIKTIKEPLNITLEDGTVVTYNPKKDVPHSWEEFLQNYPNRDDKNLCKTKEDAKAFLTLMQLRRVWHEWCKVYGYPDWKDTNIYKYSVYYSYKTNTFRVSSSAVYKRCFTFTDEKIATQFIKDFKNLLEIAKPLL